jgi:hypothetical protein
MNSRSSLPPGGRQHLLSHSGCVQPASQPASPASPLTGAPLIELLSAESNPSTEPWGSMDDSNAEDDSTDEYPTVQSLLPGYDLSVRSRSASGPRTPLAGSAGAPAPSLKSGERETMDKAPTTHHSYEGEADVVSRNMRSTSSAPADMAQLSPEERRRSFDVLKGVVFDDEA